MANTTIRHSPHDLQPQSLHDYSTDEKMKAVDMAGYTSFYGFSEDPFGIVPDPKFFFPSESHNEALASLLYGINHKKGFVLVLGEAGIGKTLLIQHLIHTLDKKGKTVLIPQSQIPFESRNRSLRWF